MQHTCHLAKSFQPEESKAKIRKSLIIEPSTSSHLKSKNFQKLMEMNNT
jgi:hypothetical protein